MLNVQKTPAGVFIKTDAYYAQSTLRRIKMKKNKVFSGLPGIALIMGFVIAGCASEGPLIIKKGVTEIPAKEYKDESYTTIGIPEGVTSIGDEAFANNTKNMMVLLPSTLKTIGKGAFRDNLLGAIKLPEGLETIGRHAFTSNAITEVNIPESVTRIDDLAFDPEVTFTGNPKFARIADEKWSSFYAGRGVWLRGFNDRQGFESGDGYERSSDYPHDVYFYPRAGDTVFVDFSLRHPSSGQTVDFNYFRIDYKFLPGHSYTLRMNAITSNYYAQTWPDTVVLEMADESAEGRKTHTWRYSFGVDRFSSQGGLRLISETDKDDK
jgi:hypothetical protein